MFSFSEEASCASAEEIPCASTEEGTRASHCSPSSYIFLAPVGGAVGAVGFGLYALVSLCFSEHLTLWACGLVSLCASVFWDLWETTPRF